MKKRNLLFILFISFILIDSVKAATNELTCVYDDGIVQKPIKVVQNSSGQLSLYENPEEETAVDSKNWNSVFQNKKVGEKIVGLGENIDLDFTLSQYYYKADGTVQEYPRYWDNSSNALSSCPYCLNYSEKQGTVTYQFKDNNDRNGTPKENCQAGWTKLVYPSKTEELSKQEWLAECVYKSENGEKVLVNFNEEYLEAFDTGYSSDAMIGSDEFNKILKENYIIVSLKDNLTLSVMMSNYKYNNRCPGMVYKGVGVVGGNMVRYVVAYSTILSDVSSGGASVTRYPLDLDATKYNKKNNDNNEKLPELQCGIFSDDLIELINDIMKWVRIIVPIMLIGFGIIDFTRATFSGKEEDMGKCKQKFIKRLIAAILVFFVPTLVELILHLANSVWSWISPETCIK